MIDSASVTAVSALALVAGVVLGVPLGRWQLAREGHGGGRLAAGLLGGLGAIALLQLPDTIALPLAVFLVAAGGTSVFVIRRELARQGRL